MKPTTIQHALANAFHVLNDAADTHMRDGDNLEILHVDIVPRKIGSPHPVIEITISVEDMHRSFDDRFVVHHRGSLITRYSIELIEDRIRVQALDHHQPTTTEDNHVR